MGTVGLSFGSPTSGTGFDVSSTVASIVSNLQNVETPWKTQLTTLEGQDTVISNLGTLFSNLSNDLSSLTDLTGIMAEKEGSSSDQNVLTLTAASSAAVAGTYTVQVTNLAQTSSGYLAQIADASDTLAGSITLQDGSGTAQTITLTSADNTLAGLAAAINSSGVGITANVLTDASGSMLSLVSGTSGAQGNITVSGNSITDTSNTTTMTPTYTGTAGAGTSYSSGSLTPIASVANDTLSGSISIQVGSSGSIETIDVPPASSTPPTNNLAGLASAINTAGIGVTASVVTNSDGSGSLSLVSQTAGAAGTLTVTPSIVDTTNSLPFISTVTGSDANLTVNGIHMTSASNTVANLIPGVTFQLLAPSPPESDGSLEQVQVVIANDNSGVESTMNQFVSDYNSLVSAMNTQEGNDSSGNPEPLFGSPTLSLLQQQLLGGLNTANPNGSLDSIATDTATTVSGSISIAMGSGQTQTFTVGSGTDDPATNTYFTGTGSDYNTLQGLADAINAAAAGGYQVTYSGTAGSDTVTSSGTMVANSTVALSGSVNLQVGSGTVETVVFGDAPSTGAAANTVYTGSTSSDTTLAGLAAAIHTIPGTPVSAGVTTTGDVSTLTLTSGTSGSDGTLTVTPSIMAAGSGVSANVVTLNGQSTLTLLSQTAGSSGALTVNSKIAATSDTLLSFSGTEGTSTTPSVGTLTTVANQSDVLSGSISIQVGSGAPQTVDVDPSNNTLSGLAETINDANLGVTAVVNSAGTTLSFLSGTSGAAGTLNVTSGILDTSNLTTTTLNYTNSSDIGSLTGLGISVNNDGSITFDAASLDSVLNSDYSGVLGFFQNADGWGQTFASLLTNAGTSSPTGTLALAESANSNSESTLNANLSKEESLISIQQKSLTAELNSANEVLQELPTQLQGINELYSAITGYNSTSNG